MSAKWVLLAALVFLSGTGPALGSDRVTVTNYGLNITTLPWAVALERGFLQKQGLDIDGFIGSSGGGSSIRNMMASSIPFAEVALPAAVAALQSGINLKIVYNALYNLGDLSWIVRKDSPLKTVADLRGHKVAFSAPQSVTEMALRMILDAHHLSKDVTAISAGTVPAAMVALDQGAVDAAPVEEPVFSNPDKYRVLFRVSDEIPKIVTQVGVVTADYAKAHPDTIRRLIAARRDALVYMYAHAGDTAQVYAKVWNSDDPRINEALSRLIKRKYWSQGAIDQPAIEVMLRGMTLVGALDKPLDLQAVIDTSYLPPGLPR